MSKQPQKRLGRGLDSLINGGLSQPKPPAFKIDSTRIERTDTPAQNNAAGKKNLSQNVGEHSKKDLIEDLNHLLKKTQDEVAGEEKIFSNSADMPQDENAQAQKELEGTTGAQPQKTPPAANNENSGASVGSAQGVFMLLPLTAIRLSPYQRRKEFAPEALKDLENSIRAEGLMQPIVVRSTPTGYELIAGERRLRACTSIGMEVIPARVVNVADASAAIMGLIENLQRENLNPVEEARGYGMLLTDFHMTQEQIAERVGKGRATIGNSLRLLMLEVEILGYIAKNQLSLGHAKVLLGLPEGPERVLLARLVVEQGLSVRQTEALTRRNALIANSGAKLPGKRLASAEEMAVINDLQKRLTARLNTKVSLNHGAKGGKITVYYKSNNELEGLLKKIGV